MEQEENQSGIVSPPQKRTGLYSRVDIKKLDRRTRLGRHVKAFLGELYRDLGGEECVSFQVKLLIEDVIIPQHLALRTFTQFLAKSDFKGVLPDHLGRYWVSLCNSYRLSMISIGLNRKAEEPLDLKTYLAKKERGE